MADNICVCGHRRSPAHPLGVSQCQFEGCGQPQYSRGWCKMHYTRWKRHGDPSVRLPHASTKTSVEERFWEKVDRSGGVDSCWEWLAGKDADGYGKFNQAGVDVRAHRFSYELHVGPIPDGMVIDHLCRNRACQNAKHMEPVTSAENSRRGEGWKVNGLKTHCPRGHLYSVENTYVRRSTGQRFCIKCRDTYYREVTVAKRRSAAGGS